MNPQKKVTSRQQSEEQQELNQNQTQQQVQEFATVEDMLRHDALHTPVPPSIEHRLQDSVGQSPPPKSQAWWRRFFGR